MERTDGLEPQKIIIEYQDGSKLECDKAVIVYQTDTSAIVETTGVSLQQLIAYHTTLHNMIAGIIDREGLND